ncbi:CDGSH iron-sulfur domain-containing protein [Agromyces sp. H66]|uniref:CDGSH iron-sulfur domain-containing protein n=1 Tax=Agromyces sp. H66 TaxID=2529859 RepID=UPI0010AB3C4A|nr:CDGSH iron-sulfur domain-containing protein [Agromyces sp. H66]
MTDAEASARPVSITACPDGPLLVRGDLALLDEHGAPIEPNRRTFALCRCGASAVRPFCDGSHKLVGFRTGPPPRTPAVTYEDEEWRGTTG